MHRAGSYAARALHGHVVLMRALTDLGAVARGDPRRLPFDESHLRSTGHKLAVTKDPQSFTALVLWGHIEPVADAVAASPFGASRSVVSAARARVLRVSALHARRRRDARPSAACLEEGEAKHETRSNGGYHVDERAWTERRMKEPARLIGPRETLESPDERPGSLLNVLRLRGILVAATTDARIRETRDPALLDRWLERALVATSVDEVLAD